MNCSKSVGSSKELLTFVKRGSHQLKMILLGIATLAIDSIFVNWTDTFSVAK